jgi:hypothetical protein
MMMTMMMIVLLMMFVQLFVVVIEVPSFSFWPYGPLVRILPDPLLKIPCE